MRILLIGGTGFIGQYLSKQLSIKEDNEVIVVHFSPIKSEDRLEAIDYHQIDLNKPTLQLNSLIKDIDIMVILIQPDTSKIQNIISATVGATKLKKIVYLSTLLLYPDFPFKQDESIAPEPKTEYEKDKYQEELLLSEFTKRSDYQLFIARLGNVYGDVKNKGIINRIFLSLIKGNDLIIRGKGDRVRDYIFIEDVVRLLEFLIFLNRKNQQEIFNICAGQGYTVRKLISVIEQITEKKINFRSGNSVLEKRLSIGDNQKIFNLSHYQLKYNLTSGLKKTYNNYLREYSSSKQI